VLVLLGYKGFSSVLWVQGSGGLGSRGSEAGSSVKGPGVGGLGSGGSSRANKIRLLLGGVFAGEG